MKTPTSLSLLLLCFLININGLDAQIDLQLNMSGNPLTPEAFKNFDFSITATNTGSSTATGVEIDIPLTAGFTYQGGNEYTASQGTYDVFVERKWLVGSLASGATATIDLHLYSLQSNQLYLYAEVSKTDQGDVDSSPANGGCPGPDPSTCSISEDDEAIVVLSNSGVCTINATAINTTCLDPLNTPDPLDDQWSVSFQVDATNAFSNGWITSSQGFNGAMGTYGQVESLGNFFISSGPLEFTLFDQQNNGCFTTFTVSPPPPCSNSNCSLQASTSAAICSDSGTPNDPSDDGFQFILFVNPNNPISNKYRARISNNNTLDIIEMAYNQDLLISKFIADGPVHIEISDLIDPNCNTTISINPTTPCSTPSGNGVDLELSLTSSNLNPAIYTTNTFVLQIANTGTTTATGIQVELPANPNLAYVSHSTTQGIYSNWLGNWEVGSLAAGATASLEINLFTLTANAEKLFAQVKAQNETDLDSSPGNGVCCVSNEDDEAVLEINGGSVPTVCTYSPLLPVINCYDNNSPDPADDQFTFTLNPAGANLGSSFSISGGGLSLGNIAYGQAYTSPLLPISAGSFLLSVEDISGNCSQQVSIIAPAPCSTGGPVGTDLEMAISSDHTTISSWEFLSMTLTLQNTGSEMASGVEVSFPLPEGLVFTGGTEYSASQGTYEDFFEVWKVGNLPAGGTAMIEFSLFSLKQTSNPVIGYSQVLQMNENDIDSSPGNGFCCTPNEDDEASLSLIPTNNPINKQTSSEKFRPALRQLYPNPANNQINLVLESPSEQIEWLAIYDARGQLVLHREYSLKEGINFTTLPISDLVSGIYLLYLSGAKRQNASLPFLIQR